MSDDATVTVAVIGGGPSGMFFCHALRKTSARVRATCFERSSAPGGVWRSGTKDGIDMYDQLWMNGPSHLIELPDYTFDEHFEKPVSVYLNRQSVFDYLTARVTRDCPDFFERYFKFRTEVQRVDFDEGIGKFIVTTMDLNNDSICTQHFDKCIWACGDNGKKKIPERLSAVFREGGYKGDVIHSADATNLERYVRDKRVLLVGGNYSGEDLALQSIKLGVEKVYAVSRVDDDFVSKMKFWPYDKVEVIPEYAPVGITKDGKGVQLAEVEWRPPNVYTQEEEPDFEIADIDTVIFCTGYTRNYDMLSESLREQIDVPTFVPVSLPEGWKPKPHVMDDHIDGEVELGKTWINTPEVHPNLYHGVLMTNPNFIHLTSPDAECILYSLDIYAYAAAMFVSGSIQLPDRAEMKRLKQEEILRFFDEPLNRMSYDENYFDAVSEIEGYMDGEMDEEVMAALEKADDDHRKYQLDVLVRVICEVGYPDDIGVPGELNERGLTRIRFGVLSDLHRSKLTVEDESERKWKTYRDGNDWEEFFSLFTSTRCTKLERPWLEM